MAFDVVKSPTSHRVPQMLQWTNDGHIITLPFRLPPTGTLRFFWPMKQRQFHYHGTTTYEIRTWLYGSIKMYSRISSIARAIVRVSCRPRLIKPEGGGASQCCACDARSREWPSEICGTFFFSGTAGQNANLLDNSAKSGTIGNYESVGGDPWDEAKCYSLRR